MTPRRKFRFIKELAQGGFGTVYLAEMVTGGDFSSVVAIKVLHGRWTTHDEIVMRARDEARLLGRLRHRNIVRVEDLTAIRGQCAIIMEYLEGVDLKSMISFLGDKGEVMPMRAVFEIWGHVAAALDAAWSHIPLQGGAPLRLVHRDIKPSNVMVTSGGDVKLLDFGTARANFDTREAHTQQLAFGSQAYMAPERFMGEPDTPSGDIFSLGISLFECIAGYGFGKIHLRPQKFEALVEERLSGLDLNELTPQLGDQVRATLRLMLAYDVGDRPTPAQVVDIMEALSDEVSGVSLRRFCRKHVVPAMKANPHEPSPDDPFSGVTLVEDRSASFETEGLDEVRPVEESERVDSADDPSVTTAEMLGEGSGPIDTFYPMALEELESVREGVEKELRASDGPPQVEADPGLLDAPSAPFSAPVAFSAPPELTAPPELEEDPAEAASAGEDDELVDDPDSEDDLSFTVGDSGAATPDVDVQPSEPISRPWGSESPVVRAVEGASSEEEARRVESELLASISTAMPRPSSGAEPPLSQRETRPTPPPARPEPSSPQRVPGLPDAIGDDEDGFPVRSSTGMGLKIGLVVAVLALIGVLALVAGGGDDEEPAPVEATATVAPTPAPTPAMTPASKPPPPEPVVEAAAEPPAVEPPTAPATEPPASAASASVPPPSAPVAAAEPAVEAAAVEAPPVEEPAAPEPASSTEPPGKLTLTLAPIGAGSLMVKDSHGFRKEWDGSGMSLRLDSLRPGTYTTKFTPKDGGASARGAIEVQAGKACTYRYNADKGSWESRGCK